MPGREQAQEAWEIEQRNFDVTEEAKVEKGPEEKI
jgi:hypothetical protein